MTIASRGPRLLSVTFLSPASERNNREALAPWLLSYPAGRFKTIEPRHPHIHQDDLGPELLRPINRLHTIVGRVDLIPQQEEHFTQRLSPIAIVIHDENATFRPR